MQFRIWLEFNGWRSWTCYVCCFFLGPNHSRRILVWQESDFDLWYLWVFPSNPKCLQCRCASSCRCWSLPPWPHPPVAPSTRKWWILSPAWTNQNGSTPWRTKTRWKRSLRLGEARTFEKDEQMSNIFNHRHAPTLWTDDCFFDFSGTRRFHALDLFGASRAVQRCWERRGFCANALDIQLDELNHDILTMRGWFCFLDHIMQTFFGKPFWSFLICENLEKWTRISNPIVPSERLSLSDLSGSLMQFAFAGLLAAFSFGSVPVPTGDVLHYTISMEM